MENSRRADLCLPEMLFQQGPACNWILNQNLEFYHVEGDPYQVFHQTADELLGRNLTESLPPEIRSAWRQRIDRVFSGETLFLRELLSSPLREPGQAGAVYSITHFPIRSAAGKILFVAGFAQDLTSPGTAGPELRNGLRLRKAHETERAGVAQFLHDEVGQYLSVVGLQLDLLRMDFEKSVPEVSSRAAEIQGLLETLMEWVREFSYELNSAVMERAGLPAALDRLVGRLRRSFPGTLRLIADSGLSLPPQAASGLYRLAQQAVENAIQRSGCSLVEILLKPAQSGLTLEVRDNGKELDCSDAIANCRGSGLLVMEHYAVQSNIGLSITSDRRKRTVVKAVYPSQEPAVLTESEKP